MPRKSLEILATPAIAVGLAVLLTACGSDADNDAAEAAPAGDDATEVDSAAEESGTDADAEDDASGGGLHDLYAAELHAGVDPAEPGTAYIIIEGERLDFTGVECTLTEVEDFDSLQFIVQNDTDYGVTELSVSRAIGVGRGFDYEEELVQVTHLGGTGGRELNDISIAQNAGAEDGSIEWYRGDGPDPMLQIVGSDVTATGTLGPFPGSENPSEGEFSLAANCG